MAAHFLSHYLQISGLISTIRLDLAGLLVLAPLKSVARQTVTKGTASWLDIFCLAPGLHLQQSAPELSRGEYPPTGALTTGYIFRVENEATVCFLQRVGVTGHLTNIVVVPASEARGSMVISVISCLHLVMTTAALVFDVLFDDRWAVLVLLMLIFSRLCNVVVLKRRGKVGWKGMSEPGVHGDLLVLLSQDRWIRMRGLVDDLKAVTSGMWLRDATAFEDFVISCATMTVYSAAILTVNASVVGNFMFLWLMLSSAVFLELANGATTDQRSSGRTLRVHGEPILYARRLDLVDQLIEESGREDWALGLGMISKSKLDDRVINKKALL